MGFDGLGVQMARPTRYGTDSDGQFVCPTVRQTIRRAMRGDFEAREGPLFWHVTDG